MSADPLDDASQHEQEMRDDGIADACRFLYVAAHCCGGHRARRQIPLLQSSS